jgi:Tol biopolymer transport system component/C-terminal processing protease CtpA/Prc
VGRRLVSALLIAAGIGLAAASRARGADLPPEAGPPRPYLRFPAISPDGRTIAFCYAGDIYLAPAEGGDARLVISHPAYDWRPRFSPDGTRLAFSSERSGGGDVYTFDLRTGALARLTFHEALEAADAWSPDGAYVYFSSPRGFAATSDVLRVPAAGGTPEPVLADPYEHEYNAAISPDGTLLAFNTGDALRQWWRMGPREDDGTQIWLRRATGGECSRVTTYGGKNSWPLFAPDGRALYFVSDEGGAENIWTCALDGSQRRPLTAFSGGRVLFPQVALRDGAIVFERDFGIWRLDPRTGKAGPIDIRVLADESKNPVARTTFGGDVEEFEVSPDGRKVAFVVHGEVFAAPTSGGGDAFRVTRTPARERGLAWCPDSARLLYSSDRGGDPDLYAYDFRTGEETRLTDSPKADLYPAVSPDGRLVAYVCGQDEIRILDLATHESRRLSRIDSTDVDPADERPAWSPDGKWLAYFDADAQLFKNVFVQAADAPEGERRQVTYLANVGAGSVSWLPNGRSLVLVTGHNRNEGRVVRVDLRPPAPELPEERFDALFRESPPQHGATIETESGSAPRPATPAAAVEPAGLRDRLRRLVPFAANVWQAAVSRDGETLVYVQGGAGRDDIYTCPLAPERGDRAARLTDLPTGSDNLRLDPDGKTLWFRSDGRIRAVPLAGGPVRTLEASATLEIDFHAEKRAVFREAWRLIRDHFYDPKMRGLDWEATRRRYEPVIAGVRDPVDLHDAISLMLGELNASHLGSWKQRPRAEAPSGDLGIDWDAAALAGGRLVVRALVPGGPAASAGGIAPGDEVLAVEGAPLARPASLDAALVGTAGHRVRLTLAPGRALALRAASVGEVRRLRYRAWVRANEALLDRLSKGRLGYVHMVDMTAESLDQFELDLDTQAHGREGVVVDVRWNRGGWVAPFVIDVLARRSTLEGVLRDRGRASAWTLAGERVLDRPTILVQNRASLSNAEMFAEAYRRLGLGKIVGTPSCGWVLWTDEVELLDGATFRLPRWGITTPAGESLDEVSRRPDLLVERAVAEAGDDPQLAAAARELLAEIDARPKAGR